jgi:hypothetical protein
MLSVVDDLALTRLSAEASPPPEPNCKVPGQVSFRPQPK